MQDGNQRIQPNGVLSDIPPLQFMHSIRTVDGSRKIYD